MHSRCLICRSPFPSNGVLEQLPMGDRVAFDVERGRLWLICRRCRRWSLAHIEDRWEALEELDRLTSGTGRGTRSARLLSRTEHVSLLQVGSVAVVRIGETDLAEEAWWRYGGQLSDPRLLDRMLPALARRIRFGSVAWRGEKVCPGCGFVFTELPFHDRKILIVRPEEGEGCHALTRRCPRCRDTEEGGLHLRGIEAELVMSRMLAYENLTFASRSRIQAATRIIEGAGGTSALVRLLTRHGRPLGDLPPIGTTALEMYAAETRERTRLRLELEELKARWHQEEQLAAIMDGELTPEPRLQDP